MDRNLALELVRVTEAAALASARYMGKGDYNAADKAAALAMELAISGVKITGNIIIGDEEKTVAKSEQLLDKGLLVTAIRPPTVPKGTARLRITLSAAHNNQQIDQLIEALTKTDLSSTIHHK